MTNSELTVKQRQAGKIKPLLGRSLCILCCGLIVLAPIAQAQDKKSTKNKAEVNIEASGFSANLKRQLLKSPTLNLDSTPETLRAMQRMAAARKKAASAADAASIAESKARKKKVVRKLEAAQGSNDKPVINTSSQFIFKDISRGLLPTTAGKRKRSNQQKNDEKKQQRLQRVERLRQKLFKSKQS